jgi:hypothetical protein
MNSTLKPNSSTILYKEKSKEPYETHIELWKKIKFQKQRSEKN